MTKRVQELHEHILLTASELTQCGPRNVALDVHLYHALCNAVFTNRIGSFDPHMQRLIATVPVDVSQLPIDG